MDATGLAKKIAAMACVAGAGMVMSSAQTVSASSHGDSNKGDVWVDNVGQPAGPGHEMDPHLSCTDINLWGDKLADPSGTYTIDSWPGTGNQNQVYASTWHYNGAQGGDQVTSVIPVQTLVNNAIAAGATPNKNQGFHFKLEFGQDPQKHKTFWVNCPAPSGSGGGTTPTPTPVVTPTPLPGGGGAPTPTPVPGGGSGGLTTPAPTPSGSGSPAVGTVPAAVGAVKGISTGSGAPAVKPAVVGGVQGISTGTPVTGARVALGALILLILGAMIVTFSRLRFGRSPEA